VPSGLARESAKEGLKGIDLLNAICPTLDVVFKQYLLMLNIFLTNLVSIWAAAPSTQRASPVHLSTDAKGRLAYASNKSIYIRDIANPGISLQYNGHLGLTSVAKFSPSGFYMASGGYSLNMVLTCRRDRYS
jgi:hypothetical protein